MPTTNIQAGVDSALKAEAEQLFSDVGRDPFYFISNQQALCHSIAQMEKDQVVRKTMSELETME